MTNVLDKIKPSVKALRAYTLSPDRASVKINQNENPWDAPEGIKAETLRRMSARFWSRYPDFVPASLHERLAEFSGWSAAGILAGNGSNELIQALLVVSVGGRKASTNFRTDICTLSAGSDRARTAKLRASPLTDELQYDVARLAVEDQGADSRM